MIRRATKQQCKANSNIVRHPISELRVARSHNIVVLRGEGPPTERLDSLRTGSATLPGSISVLRP